MNKVRTRTSKKAKRKQFTNNCGYTIIVSGNKTRHQHRLIWERYRGPIPPGHHVHHRNGLKTDNRISNLQLLPASEHLRQHALAHRDAIRERARITAAKLRRDERGRFMKMMNSNVDMDYTTAA